MKTIIDTKEIEVKETGQDYDFIGTVFNKTDKRLCVTCLSGFQFPVEANDWVGLLADNVGRMCLEDFKNGDYDVEIAIEKVSA